MRRLIAGSSIVLAAAFSTAPVATADTNDHKVTSGVNSAVVKAWKSTAKGGSKSKKPVLPRSSGTEKVKTTPDPQAIYAAKVAAYEQYQALMRGWTRCAADGCPKPPAAVPPPGAPPAPQAALNGPPLPTITPEQAAYVAIARLRLTPPKPVIGPSPEINEWHMAAVGYPYWLWTEGNLDPAPVSTTVADLTVRLDAHLQSTTFDLGDGTRLTCTDLTKKWSPAVEPGAASPACGHTYTRPSLPKGTYTITASSTWAVDWSVNGVGGTIPLYQQASTTVPVGELQVLTH